VQGLLNIYYYNIFILSFAKALTSNTDHYIYTQLTKGQEDNVFFKDAVANMLRTIQNEGLITQKDVLKYIGNIIRFSFIWIKRVHTHTCFLLFSSSRVLIWLTCIVRFFLGERFRIKLTLPDWTTDEEVAIFLFTQCVLVHLNAVKDKFNLLM